MNPLQKNITEIAEQVAQRLGFLLIEVSLKGDNRNRIIEVFIDSLKGVTIDECAEMSREVASVIESSDLITSKYRLDVSSPGIDRPLKFLEQFPKHINRKFEILLKDTSTEQQPESRHSDPLQAKDIVLPESNFQSVENNSEKSGSQTSGIQKGKSSSKPQKLVGKLLSVDGQMLKFNVNNAETNINFNNIKTAKVLISF